MTDLLTKYFANVQYEKWQRYCRERMLERFRLEERNPLSPSYDPLIASVYGEREEDS